MTQEKFINRVNAIYGDRYDFSKVIYKGWADKVIVIDNYTKEEKEVKPKNFLYNYQKYKRLTKEEKANAFIKKSKEKFGDKFDYSKVEYIDSQTPVTLICKEHGEFSVNMYTHLYSKDGLCPLCKGGAMEFRRGGAKRLSTGHIVKKCQLIYGNKYDYSKVKYKGGSAKTEKVEIICPMHGSFFKIYDDIQKRDNGCPKCAKEKKRLNDAIHNAEKFIERSKEKFGDKFDYSEVKYINSLTPITLICKEHGTRFSTIPNVHLNSKFGGCKECFSQHLSNIKKLSKSHQYQKLTKEEKEERKIERGKNNFIKKATSKFGDRFDYSEVKYIDCNTLVNIIDKESNNEKFSVTPSRFLHSVDGRADKIEKTRADLKSRAENFIKRAKELHGDKYDYSKVNYINKETKVCIICPIHGEFNQTPANHLSSSRNGCGCPKCSHMVSKLEVNVINRLTTEGIKFKSQYINEKLFGKMRGDFFIKSYNVMIECQGKQHFEERNSFHKSYGGSLSGQIRRDYIFNKSCKDANIKLFYYFNKSDTKCIDYLNDKKFNGIYTMENTFTSIDSLMSCIKNEQP